MSPVIPTEIEYAHMQTQRRARPNSRELRLMKEDTRRKVPLPTALLPLRMNDHAFNCVVNVQMILCTLCINVIPDERTENSNSIHTCGF